MMLPELSEIKNQRKKLGLTQTELAMETKVSQSLIAKIEANSIVPSYSNAKKLFDFFEIIKKKYEAKAGEFMTHKVLSVKSDSTVKSAIKTMEKYSVSQLPVIDEGKNLGMISERIVLEQINNSEQDENTLEKEVSAIMAEAMPQITESTPFDVVSAIMKHSSGVLVTKQGKVIGIITKADLLKSIVSKNK
ncbi:MAG: CBS domain-containing protein [archaeon]|nr:CBS domain-containing protein [archaeon]